MRVLEGVVRDDHTRLLLQALLVPARAYASGRAHGGGGGGVPQEDHDTGDSVGSNTTAVQSASG